MQTYQAYFVVLAVCLVHVDGFNFRGDNTAAQPHTASFDSITIFAAVSTRRASKTQRSFLRGMWQKNVDLAGDTAGGPRLVYRFMLCNDTDGLADEILSEYDEHKDMMLLECEEGSDQGRLTIKTLHMMMAYWKVASNFGMFMKTDDTTFVDWQRLEQALSQEAAMSSPYNMYVGAPFEETTPCREYEFATYEPFFAFAGSTYPRGMEGGPGYMLGHSLVQSILAAGIASNAVLWNEDRAVSVWVDYVRSHGHQTVSFVEVPGGSMRANAAAAVYSRASAWEGHSWVLYHGLSGESIQCLTDKALVQELDMSGAACLAWTPASETVSTCVNKITKVETEQGVIEVP